MTNYPAQIDNTKSLPLVVDNFTPITAGLLNGLRGAIVAIEQELGVKPSGTFSTVRARLDEIQSSIDNISGIKLGGDIGGTNNNPLVIGIYGRPVSNIAPISGQVLGWNGVAWIPVNQTGGGGGSVIFGGDLTGTSTNQTVVGLFNRPLSSSVPLSGQALVYNGSQWVPGTNFGAQTVQTTGQLNSGPALLTSATTALLELNGKLVASAVSSAYLSGAGQGIIYFDATAQQFLVSQNGSDYFPLLVGGGSVAGGDLTGLYPNPTIEKIQGNPITITSPTLGNYLYYNSSNEFINGSLSSLKIEWFNPSTSDLGAAIQAAVNALPIPNGGIIDATGLRGNWTWHTPVNISRPVKLLLDSINITSTTQSMFTVQDNFTLSGTDGYATRIYPQADGYVLTFVEPYNHPPFFEPTYGTGLFIMEKLYVFGGATAVNTTGFLGLQEADICVQDCTFNNTTYFALIFNSAFYYSRVLRCMFDFCYGSALVYDDTETLFRDNVHAVAATGAQNILLINPDFVNIENDRFFGEPPNIYPDVEIQVQDSFSWTGGWVTIKGSQFRAEREQWLNQNRVRIRTSSTSLTGNTNGSVNTNIDGCWFLGPNALQITSIGRSSGLVTATLSTAWPSGHGLQIGDKIQVATGMTDTSFLGTFTVTAVGSPSESQTVSWNQAGSDSGQSNKFGFLFSLETAAIRFEAPIGRYTVTNNNFSNYPFAIDDSYPMTITGGNGAIVRDIADRSVFENNPMIGPVGYQCQEFKLGGRFFSKLEAGEDSPLQSFNTIPNNKEQIVLQNRILDSESQNLWNVIGACSVVMGATDPYGTTRAAHVSRTGAAEFCGASGGVSEGIQSSPIDLTSLGTLSYLKFWAKGGPNTELASINILADVNSVFQPILFRTISLSPNWKQYKIPIVWPTNTTVAFFAYAPGDIDAMVADGYVWAFQISDTDCDYIATTSSSVSNSTFGTLLQKPILFNSGLTAGVGLVTVNIPDASFTLTAAQQAADFIDFTGTLTANRFILLNTNTAGKSWLMRNSTSGGFPIYIDNAGNTSQTNGINPGETRRIFCDGTNVGDLNSLYIEGAETPNTRTPALPGTIYQDTADDLSSWIKQSGVNTSTGWVNILNGGYVTAAIPDPSNLILTPAQNNALIIKLTGTLTADRFVIASPNGPARMWIVINATTGGHNVLFGNVSAVATVAAGTTAIVWGDGAGNWYNC